MSADGQAMPVLLLKTRSGPTDAYEELFSAPPRDGFAFEPAFVPVLQHQFEEAGLARVRDALRRRRIGRGADAEFGGLVFTSQRAVEAFAKLVAEGPGGDGEGQADAAADAWPHLQDVPVYSVGPATTRALRAVPQTPPLQVFGEHTGNGDALARFILDHYGAWYGGGGSGDDEDGPKPPLLFLVGEQRRDVIPRTLMDPALSAARRVPVVEVVVYGTGVMASFPRDFAAELRRTARQRDGGGGVPRWVVVFSPTGCDSMLRGLGRLGPHQSSEDGAAAGSSSPDKAQEVANDDEGAAVPTYIATIGPTTRDYLQRTFGYEPDVCAETPSPEGVWEGITRFMASSKAG